MTKDEKTDQARKDMIFAMNQEIAELNKTILKKDAEIETLKFVFKYMVNDRSY